MAVQDPPMPDEIRAYMRERRWGDHHLKWHRERWWYRFTPARRRALEADGYTAAERLEGDPGNGLDFLAMHRVMLRELVAAFPHHESYFDGWATPPTDPDDEHDEVPMGGDGEKPPFPEHYRRAVQRIENRPDSFADDDAFGLYIQTSRNQSDLGAGIHNWLHSRWMRITTELNLGNPTVNMHNARFWRLHGWIDRQWTAFRSARGLEDDQPEYVAALDAARAMMQAGTTHHHLEAGHLKSIDLERVVTSPSLEKALFDGTSAQQAEHRAEGQSPRYRIDFDSADVVAGIVADTWFLVVSGYKPYANMQVALEPRIYVRQPDHWVIEVVGALPGPGLPMIAPFSVAIPLAGVTGTQGVRVVGDTRQVDLAVPPGM